MTKAQPIIRRALLSVSDKTGLVDLARALAGARRRAGLHRRHGEGARATPGCTVRDVAELTGFPEMMDGRVKTLHPKVHGGLLALRDNAEHAAAMRAHGIAPIDLLVVNLYPFEATVAQGRRLRRLHREHRHRRPGDDPRRGQEPRLRRRWWSIPRDYAAVLAELDAERAARPRSRSASSSRAKAYARTAAYDAAISDWFAGAARRRRVPPTARFGGKLRQTLRYGENPHQAAAFYRHRRAAPRRRHRARRCRARSSPTTTSTTPTPPSNWSPNSTARHARPCAIIKHANPCGVATGATLAEAYAQGAAPAIRSRPSAASSRSTARSTARRREAIAKIFTEVIIAPDADDEAQRASSRRRRTCAC